MNAARSGLMRAGMIAFFVVLAVAIGLAFTAFMKKYMRGSITAESINNLGQIAKHVSLTYESTHRLCTSASRSVPAGMEGVRGKRYTSTRADWDIDRGENGGFSCMHFAIDEPQRYLYGYVSAPDAFTATARGDVDGDEVESVFVLGGKVVQGKSGEELWIEPSIAMTQPEE